MSLFLGKIHYWLFNKIIWFEGLEDEIKSILKDDGINIESLDEKLNEKYGEKSKSKNLEEIIDQSNIHGWLQNRIYSSEGRVAYLVSRLLEKGDSYKEKLEVIFINQGMKAAKEVKKNKGEPSTAVEIFTEINNYILDGMPCDRVNEIISSDDNEVKWKRRICVHKAVWEKENVDVNEFYGLRSLWIKAFVTELNSNFNYVEKNDGTMIIEKV